MQSLLVSICVANSIRLHHHIIYLNYIFVFHHEVQWNELLCLRVCLYITPFRRRKSESEWEERKVILGADSRWTSSCYLYVVILRFSNFQREFGETLDSSAGV